MRTGIWKCGALGVLARRVGCESGAAGTAPKKVETKPSEAKQGQAKQGQAKQGQAKQGQAKQGQAVLQEGASRLGLTVAAGAYLIHLDQTNLLKPQDQTSLGLRLGYVFPKKAGRITFEGEGTLVPLKIAGGEGKNSMLIGLVAAAGFGAYEFGKEKSWSLQPKAGWGWFSFTGNAGAVSVNNAQGPRLGGTLGYRMSPRDSWSFGAAIQPVLDGLGIGTPGRNLRFDTCLEYQRLFAPRWSGLARLEFSGFSAQPRGNNPMHYRGRWFALSVGAAF